MSSRRFLLAAYLLVLSSGAILAVQPIPNWPAPPTWTPPRAGFGARVIQSDVTSPLPFIGTSPCRVVDTRNANGPFGGPIFSVAEARTYPLSTNPACLGFPAASTIQGYSVNITVTQTAGTGFVSAYPSGTTRPVVSTVNFIGTGQSVSNAAIVPAGSGGSAGMIDVYASQQTHVIIDVNGYYSSSPANQENFFQLNNNSSLYTMYLTNASTSCTGNCGLIAVTSTASGGNAVAGIATGGSGLNYGVVGRSLSTTFNSAAVHGESNGNGQTIGVEGICVGGSPSSLCAGVVGRGRAAGGYFTSDGTGGSGVQGLAFGTSGVELGVYGFEASTDADSAGIKGVDAGGSLAGPFHPAGVRGESKDNYGVLGVSQSQGVAGYLLNSVGSILSAGYLGYSSSVGVSFFNGLAGTGTKSFVEPHPTDASKVIRYVSLEGPEAGTYFRGTDQTRHSVAVIQVPESFRLVTDTEGLTVQLTPVGASATMYVVSQDLNQIEVRSSQDVKFHYMVNGVRKAYPHWIAIQDNEKFFVPESPSDRLPGYLSEEERGRLIRNGTYNADGSVNMDTAERVGWTKAWAEREARAKAAAAEAQRAVAAK